MRNHTRQIFLKITLLLSFFSSLLRNCITGKSSFINYVMGRNVQTAGVAPPDDCFTVIAPGPEDTDQDGKIFIEGV